MGLFENRTVSRSQARRRLNSAQARRLRLLLSGLIIWGLLMPSLLPLRAQAAGHPARAGDELFPPSPGELPNEQTNGGLTLLLDDGVEQAAPGADRPAPAGEPLDQATTDAILDRLPPLEEEAADAQEFRLPPDSLPAPRTGAVIDVAFPPAEDADVPTGTPPSALEVLRFAPEGEIPVAPFLNVTFNQPMVPLTTLDQLTAADVPVVLTPELPGVWKWLGTKTLSFEYAGDEFDRFPMATEYTARIPAGTTSPTGATLAADVEWRFTTPPPTVVNSYPSYGPQPRDPLLFIQFDQKIDPAAMLNAITVTAQREPFAVELADAAAVAADPQVSRLAAAAPDGRWLAFRAMEEFPADTTVGVVVQPGAPSAEGPLVTTKAQSFSFQTYPPLRLVEHRCSYYDGECPPLTPFMLRFNNQLDAAQFDDAALNDNLFTIQPEVPNLTVNFYGNTVELSGATAGQTTYSVTISGMLRDIFGQTLGDDQIVTFTTGEAPSVLTGPDFFVTLDPATQRPALTIYTINVPQVKVRAFAVTPADWPAYTAFQNEYRYQQKLLPVPGQEVLNTSVKIDGVTDQLTATNIDLQPLLTDGLGHLIVLVEMPATLSDLFGRGPQRVVAWVQSTRIGLDAFTDHSEMVAWATDLADGAPLPGVTVSLLNTEIESAVTDEAGLARLRLPVAETPLLVGEQDGDTAILPAGAYYWYNGGWSKRTVTDELRWYVFDDRQMYRPGERVHVKGWLREIGGGQTGDVTLPPASGLSLRYQLVDARGNEIANAQVDLNDLAGFDLTLDLPDNINLGYTTLYFTVQGAPQMAGLSYAHSFQVQEFRRPEFEVTARPQEDGPYFIGDDATTAVQAAYFAGGPLPNAETNWTVVTSPGAYRPPNWPDFIFGSWTPWWAYWESDNGNENVQTFAGRTDATGTHYLHMTFVESDAPRPYSISAAATVMDLNRQAWNASTNLLVHPASLYVGLRSDTYFVEEGEPLEMQAIVTDLDGNAVADTEIMLRAARVERTYRNGVSAETEEDVQECAVTSAEEPVMCTFETTVGGEYRVTATVRDSRERLNQTELVRWVSGGQQIPQRNVEQATVLLIPDRESYAPGDSAEILVQAPFAPADGLLTVSRSGILYTTHFHMDDASTTLQIPIEDAHIPSLEIKVDLTGSVPRVDDDGAPLADVPARPAFATGTMELTIPPLNRTLELAIAPEATALEPGAATAIDLRLTDADGTPVADGELAVVVVDEAILALTGYQLIDPLAVFYSPRYGEVSSVYGRSSIVLDDPQQLLSQLGESVQEYGLNSRATLSAQDGEVPMPAMAAAMDMAASEEMAFDSGGSAAAQGGAITVRSNFDPLAVFAPAVRTDADGRARVAFTLPDNLTRYRIMVVAVAEGQYFASAESNLTARLPLMVRPSPPRFLNFGDRFELPVVLQNQTDQPLEVDVVAQVTNVELTDGAGQRVTVPANDRVEVRFPAHTLNAGTARLRIAATAGDMADAQELDLPVYTPATTEAFATYGVVDQGMDAGGAVIQPLAQPQNVFPQFGGLEITTSSTALQALTDAVIYLTDYPFACSEQLASRVLGIAALRDVLNAFQAEGLPAPDELEASVQRDLETLAGMQNADGGFPVWRRGAPSEPFYSVHVTHALARAAEKGFELPAGLQSAAIDYIRNVERHYPTWYSPQVRHTISAYALYVRQLSGDVDTAKAAALLSSQPLDAQSLEAVAWLWQVLSGQSGYEAEVEAIRRHVNNQAVETAGAANFVTSYGDDAYLLLHSNRRTDAVVLDAMINDDPENDLIPKVVTGLLAHRTQGHWSNTQENVFVLVALDRYFNTFETETPDFVARFWLGEDYLGDHAFQGRSTESLQTMVPMEYLIESGDADLILGKEGSGRLYYRLGLRYAPSDLNLPPMDMGFVVTRSYEGVDDPADVTLDEEGVWHVKLGARVRVNITMVADSRRYHVALVDPLPAGLETINPALAVSEPLPADPNAPELYGWWWRGPWFEHQNLRDQRSEAFTTLLWDGVYDYSYVARATTPGAFVAPPAKAEEMYAPEVFGRSAVDRVIIE